MNYTEMIAKGLKQHCDYWGLCHIEKLKENCSVQNFHKFFCCVTNTFYVNDGNAYYDFNENTNHYAVEFDKKEGIATVKKCGTDFNSRGIDAVVKTEDVIKLLVQNESEGKDNEQN